MIIHGLINLCVEMTAMYDVREAKEIGSGEDGQLMAFFDNPSFGDATIRVGDASFKVSLVVLVGQ